MRIIINHLTRMQAGYFCVAGIDEATGRHVRPTLGGSRLTTNLLAYHGGLFDLATCIDLGAVTPVGQPPELEDHQFDPRVSVKVAALPGDQFWGHLLQMAQPRLSALFGPDLTQQGRSAVVGIGKGTASLGCLVPTGIPVLTLQQQGTRPARLRMQFSDGILHLDLGVTDIRLYQSDHVTPNPEAVQAVNQYLAEGRRAILSLGLTRPYASSEEYTPVHWLQVNNIHLAEFPEWRLRQ